MRSHRVQQISQINASFFFYVSLPSMKIKFIILSIVVAMFSCKTEKTTDTNSNQKAIPRVFDKSLYAEDVKEILPKNTSPKDSAIFVKGFIEQWITNELLLHQAESNLS